jgi:hypothetical protein
MSFPFKVGRTYEFELGEDIAATGNLSLTLKITRVDKQKFAGKFWLTGDTLIAPWQQYDPSPYTIPGSKILQAIEKSEEDIQEMWSAWSARKPQAKIVP